MRRIDLIANLNGTRSNVTRIGAIRQRPKWMDTTFWRDMKQSRQYLLLFFLIHPLPEDPGNQKLSFSWSFPPSRYQIWILKNSAAFFFLARRNVFWKLVLKLLDGVVQAVTALVGSFHVIVWLPVSMCRTGAKADNARQPPVSLTGLTITSGQRCVDWHSSYIWLYHSIYD